MRALRRDMLLFIIMFFILLCPISANAYANLNDKDYAQSAFSDVAVLNNEAGSFSYSQKPLAQYTGLSGVTIRSYSSAYISQSSLKKVYDELMNNGNGEEIAYLSYVDLIGDYPYGVNTAGKWYGLWEDGELAKGRYIELYGCDTESFTELARALSHEYGHHFTYYYLSKYEHKDTTTIMDTGFVKIRGLNSYKDIQDGEHRWDPSEIAAEDYIQLYGSSTGKTSMKFEDVRDQVKNGSIGLRRYSTLVFNLSPQENEEIPLAWQVPGLYEYWSELSGVKAVNAKPPAPPFLALTNADNGTLTLNWTQSTDDDTDDMEYTLIAFSSENDDLFGIRTTTDNNGRDAIVGTYRTKTIIAKDNILTAKMFFRIYAKDKDGNVVCSNDLLIDSSRPSDSLMLLPNRIFGQDRYETSVNISKSGWPKTAGLAVLVTGDNFPDALSAAPLAKLHNAPVLLTGSNVLDNRVNEELDRLKVKSVIIVGGPGAIAPSIEDYIKSKGIICTRIAGKDRYDTAVEVAKSMGAFKKAVVATGDNFPDALSIASYAASKGLPIILTNGQNLPDSAAELLNSRDLEDIYVIGGIGVISDDVVSKLHNAERIFGGDRYGTNLAVISRFKSDFDLSNVYIATGDNFPDALAGSALAGMKKAPIFLISEYSEKTVKDYISPVQGSIKNINVIGGEGAVKSDIVMELLMKN